MNFNSLNNIIGTSEAIKEIKNSITDYAKSNLPILITGETGVGKEVFERLGSVKTIKLNIRFICSTNSNLEELVENKQFREDLYYRINAVKITIPPLRERISDIPALCNHFITKVNSIEGLNIQGISEDVINIFQKYCWSGNVRELEHTIHRASVLAKDGIIQTKHIQFLYDRLIKKRDALSMDNSLKGIIENVEADAIIGALKKLTEINLKLPSC